jgi:uncharacterized OsmC-like protein
MKISARVSNTPSGHTVEVETDGRKQSIAIAPKNVGRGSGINGGELLFAALATCCCNDLYREAAKHSIDVQDVKVEVTGTFGNPGEPARDISYRVHVNADAPKATIDDLIRATDSLTEIQNTLRAGCAVRLERCASSPIELKWHGTPENAASSSESQELSSRSHDCGCRFESEVRFWRIARLGPVDFEGSFGVASHQACIAS